jgi:hypothetical protein
MFLSCLGLVFASGFSIVIVHCTSLIQMEHTSRYGRHKIHPIRRLTIFGCCFLCSCRHRQRLQLSSLWMPGLFHS